jgi:uncharacterized membrane protein YdcZ (DUF606 family)
MTQTAIRWALLPFEVVFSFLVVAFTATFIADHVHVWWQPVGGFFAAIAVVGVAYARAPKRPLLVALVAFVLGSAAAYLLLWNSYFPESYPRPYAPTSIPFWVTVAGGALALFAVAVHTALKVDSTSNKSLERTREG